MRIVSEQKVATDSDRTRTLWFALLLTLTNGFMDAHTYYVRGGVFANVQTGNVIFFALDMSERKITAAMAHVWRDRENLRSAHSSMAKWTSRKRKPLVLRTSFVCLVGS